MNIRTQNTTQNTTTTLEGQVEKAMRLVSVMEPALSVARSFLVELSKYTPRDGWEGVKATTLDGAVKRLAKREGVLLNPYGPANKKLDLVGDYRKVGTEETGGTCHSDCPLMGEGCYAEGGNVRTHQVRASNDPVRSALTAVLVKWIAGITGKVGRHHVAGDAVKKDRLDLPYVVALVYLSEFARKVLGSLGDSYTYCHLPPSHKDLPLFHALAKRAGFKVRISDLVDQGGACVHPHSDFARFKRFARQESGNPKLKVAKCRNQTKEDLKCAECGICFEDKFDDILVVFDPHGAGAQGLKKKLIRELKVVG